MIDALKTAIATKFVLPMIAAALVLAGALGFAAGRYSDAVTTANARTQTAKCGEARADDNAAANAAGAQGLSASAGRAAKSDDTTAHKGEIRASGYAKAQEEANRADTPVLPSAKACPAGINPHPLFLLFDGVRNAEGAADRDGGSSGDRLSGAP